MLDFELRMNQQSCCRQRQRLSSATALSPAHSSAAWLNGTAPASVVAGWFKLDLYDDFFLQFPIIVLLRFRFWNSPRRKTRWPVSESHWRDYGTHLILAIDSMAVTLCKDGEIRMLTSS